MNNYKNLPIKSFDLLHVILNEFMMANGYTCNSAVDFSKPQLNVVFSVYGEADALLVLYFKKDGRLSMLVQGQNRTRSAELADYIYYELLGR